MTEADRRSARYRLAPGVSVQFHVTSEGEVTAVWDPDIPDPETLKKCVPGFHNALMGFLSQNLETPGMMVML